ncbi:MAG: tetratricopeptide repeat protein, partial [Spirochaetales bacterium]|nr:tetratricopeptide repeat protein [Spirochaetales bacterium]
MKMKRYLVLALLAAVLAACSSAPKEDGTVREIKNQAAEYGEYGNRYYLAADYDQALKFFSLALEMNLSVDNTPGIVESHNSLGKVYLRTGEY